MQIPVIGDKNGEKKRKFIQDAQDAGRKQMAVCYMIIEIASIFLVISN